MQQCIKKGSLSSDANFSQNGTLKRHNAAIHGEKKPFKCNICDASFAYKFVLNKHVLSVHEEKNPISMQCL